jgi:hypothetical protein
MAFLPSGTLPLEMICHGHWVRAAYFFARRNVAASMSSIRRADAGEGLAINALDVELPCGQAR